MIKFVIISENIMLNLWKPLLFTRIYYNNYCFALECFLAHQASIEYLSVKANYL